MQLALAAALATLLSACGQRVIYVPLSRSSDGARADCITTLSPRPLSTADEEERAKLELAPCLAACRKLGFTEDRELPSLAAGMPIEGVDRTELGKAIPCGIHKQQ